MMRLIQLIFLVFSCFIQETTSRKLLRSKHELQAHTSVHAADPVFLGAMKAV